MHIFHFCINFGAFHCIFTVFCYLLSHLFILLFDFCQFHTSVLYWWFAIFFLHFCYCIYIYYVCELNQDECIKSASWIINYILPHKAERFKVILSNKIVSLQSDPTKQLHETKRLLFHEVDLNPNIFFSKRIK